MNIIVGLPAFNEEKALPKLLNKLIDLKDVYGDRFKVIAVNDGRLNQNTKTIADFKKDNIKAPREVFRDFNKLCGAE